MNATNRQVSHALCPSCPVDSGDTLLAGNQSSQLYEVLSAADALIRVAHDRDQQIQHHHGAQDTGQRPLPNGTRNRLDTKLALCVLCVLS